VCTSHDAGPLVAVLASGRGSNFESLARAFDDGEIPGRIVCLVTDRAEAGARLVAERHGIPSYVLPWEGRRAFEAELLALLRRLEVEYVLLAGFMRLLGPTVVDAFEGRILNIHPSLLPAFPGLEPQARALAAGATESGCTVHFVDRGMDTGPIVAQRRVPVLPGDTVETLAARILAEEHRCYPEAVRLVLSGRVRLRGETVWCGPDGFEVRA